MAAYLLSLRLLSALFLTVIADPAPGRIPKVYNALITSNQNLEPSKSYPVYQPVLHDPFGFVHPSVLYGGEYPFGNGISPQPLPPKGAEAPAEQPPAPPATTPEIPPVEPPANEQLPPAEPASPSSDDDGSTPAPPPPPSTESPIPLNEFGLPSQVVPLGRINPAYHGFNQLGPYAYSYPGVRLYNPYDPFSLSPYGFPFYRPLPNVLGPSLGPNLFGPQFVPNYGGPNVPIAPEQAPAPAPAAAPVDASGQTPPSEPSDLNLLNYSSKDPAIPNVPPPPLPQGGLKSDKSE